MKQLSEISTSIIELTWAIDSEWRWWEQFQNFKRKDISNTLKALYLPYKDIESNIESLFIFKRKNH